MPTDYAEKARREREASRARRREFQDMDLKLRMDNERSVRLLLDEFFPAGAPDDLLERICRIQNRLIQTIISGEKSGRELHDGINRIKNESDWRWMEGFRECADQVRNHAAELRLAPSVVASLLRNDVRTEENSREVRNEAATRQVEWKRS